MEFEKLLDDERGPRISQIYFSPFFPFVSHSLSLSFALSLHLVTNTMDDSNEVDTGKIVYDWNPPTGIIDRYHYHDAAITEEDVSFLPIGVNLLTCLTL